MMKKRFFMLIVFVVCFICSFEAHGFTSNTEANDYYDIAINNVTVVDVENKNVTNNNQILIKGKIIDYIGVPKQVNSKNIVDGKNLIALPGFVNTHTHLWQHVGKGFYPDGNLQEWVQLYRYAPYFTEQELYETTLAALSQGLSSGITTVADFASVNYNDFALDSTMKALKTANVDGALIWWNPAAFLPYSYKKDEINRLQANGNPSISIWMGYGPLSFFDLPTVYDGICLSKDLNLRTAEHTMENIQEQRDLFTKFENYFSTYKDKLSEADRNFIQAQLALGAPGKVDGVINLYRLADELLKIDQAYPKLTDTERLQLQQLKEQTTISPVPILDYLGGLDNFLSIHSVWLNNDDIAYYKKHNIFVAHNPESNMYLSSGIAPILNYESANVTIGTDGAASNDRIDFFSAMRATWNLQKLRYLDTSVTSQYNAWNVLASATINGANALGIGSQTGSLTPGKEADIVLLSKNKLGMSPEVQTKDIDNIASLIVYGGGVEDVDTVLSNGKILVRGGNLQAPLSEEYLSKRLSEISNNLVSRYDQGKIWEEAYNLNLSPQEKWYKYRSVRIKDTIQLKIVNTSKNNPISITAAASGTSFGGAVGSMFGPKTRARFPFQDPKKFWTVSYKLEPGEALTIQKMKDNADYTIEYKGISKTFQGASSHELLLMNE